MTKHTDNRVNGLQKLLIFHYLKIYIRILSSCLKTFGLGIWFFYFLVKFPLRIAYINFSMFLDNLFFPGYRHVKIENPIFIIGHPRSATTFLHSILTQTEDFMVFKDWELENPSLTVRTFLKRSKILRLFFSVFDFRFTPYRLKTSLTNIIGRIFKNDDFQKMYKTRKRNIELIAQEEEALFLHVLDTQLLPLMTPLGFVEEGYPELCFNDAQPHQERSVLFLKDCFKRQIYYTGKKQIVAKMNFSLFRMKTLLKFFPDARIIYLVRSPLETIPSHLSLHRRILDRYFGLDNIPHEKLQQYYNHRYQYNVLFYKHFEELIDSNAIQKDRLLTITYRSLKEDLWNQVQRIREFASLPIYPDLEHKLKNQAQAQSLYKRKHENLAIEEFGFTEDRIRSDLDFVLRKYEFANKLPKK